MNDPAAPVILNPLRDRLLGGGLGLALQVRHALTPDIALAARTCGFDALYFDLQHTPVDERSVAQTAVAALSVGVTPIVRIPQGDYGMALRMLDSGALGIVVPDVTTAAEAREAVAACRFAPLGHRSAFGSWPHFGYRALPAVQAREVLNANTLLIVMIESAAAADNAEAIAAIPGVDVLHVGSNDLATDLGVPGQLAHPEVTAQIGRVIAACRKHGKIAGIGGLVSSDVALLKTVVDMGGRFLSAGNEWSLMIAAGQQRVQALRALEPRGA